MRSPQMVSSGIPQLQSFENIEYLKNALMIEKSDEDASEAFKGLIDESLSSVATKLNFAFHILANPDKGE